MGEDSQHKRAFEHRGYWLHQRNDTPNWQIYWCVPGTRRVHRKSTGTADFESAKECLLDFVQGQERPASSGSVPLLDLLTEHVERVMKNSRMVWPAEKTALIQWTDFLSLEGISSVEELDLDAQDRYAEWRLAGIRARGKKGSTGTIHRELGVMKAALRAAWKRGRLKTVPYVRSAPIPPPRDWTLTAEECRRLLAACQEPHLRRFVMLSLHTLQRPAAIFDLQVEQIDFARNRIDFLPPGRTQTHKRRPVIPIGAAIRTELKRAVLESNRGFIIEYGGAPLKSVKKSFATAARRAGLDGLYPYVLRHTGATLLAAAGVPLRQISGMLGHSEQKTTELYAKHRPDYLLEASETLDALFGDAGDASGTAGDASARQSARQTKGKYSLLSIT